MASVGYGVRPTDFRQAGLAATLWFGIGIAKGMLGRSSQRVPERPPSIRRSRGAPKVCRTPAKQARPPRRLMEWKSPAP
jgi:hypothetical protein